MHGKASGILRWLQRILKEESALLLWIIAILILLLETLNSLGIWAMPWFQNKLAEITLTFLLVFALGVVSQQRLHSIRLGELSRTIVAQADLSAKLKALGISEIWAEGRQSMDRRRDLFKRAKTLAAVSVSEYTWIYATTDILRNLLLEKGCHMRLLLATPDSDFVVLREKREGESRRNAISAEINATIGLFKDMVQEVDIARSNRAKGIGTLEIRFCQADIPGKIIIVNESVIHWIPPILPARSSHMPAFEVQASTESSASRLLLRCFETLWNESADAVAFKWPTQGEE